MTIFLIIFFIIITFFICSILLASKEDNELDDYFKNRFYDK